MLLISTLLRQPGIGSPDPDTPSPNPHNALTALQTALDHTAQTLNIEPPHSATPTLRKDLQTLRQYGILEKTMYRWGYYLGTGVMRPDELPLALNALATQAHQQGDPIARRAYTHISQRLRNHPLNTDDALLYPVRQHLNRVIGYTDPDDMMAKGKYRDTLFHQLDALEQAIRNSTPIELSRRQDPYNHDRVGTIPTWPLQLVYHDVAWYLIFENLQTHHLEIGRINRFGNYCRPLPEPPRPLNAQRQRLHQAHQLLENGWGLFLGSPDEQQAELQGTLPLIAIKVRFFAAMVPFILEGELRHPRQRLIASPKDPQTGQHSHVDYCISLPPRSLREFRHWLNRHMDQVQILTPADFAHHHCATAQALINRYTPPNT